MMLIGFTITVDMLVCRRLTNAVRSLITINIDEGNIFLCVRNEHLWHGSYTKYNLLHMNGIYEKMLSQGKLALYFTAPRHMIIFGIDDPSQLIRFMSRLDTLINDHKIYRTMDMSFDPLIMSYIDTPSFNKYSLSKVQCLSTLILENCNLSSIPEQVGFMPISYLSLTCSTLGTTEYEKEFFFDFMNIGTITKTLNILEMNETNIKELPFQIYFLKNLHTLSVAGNSLTFIPHYIGDLGKLSSLYINNNLLPFLPKSLYSKIFKSLNISNNKFREFSRKFEMEEELVEDKEKEGKDKMITLSHLSLLTLLENQIKFKANDIPRHLLKKYINTLSVCCKCDQFVLPDYTTEGFESGYPQTINLIKNSVIDWKVYFCTSNSGYGCTIFKKNFHKRFFPD